jgi:hypothetical protein
MSVRGPEFEHALCNQVSIVLGYCELLLAELPPDSPWRADLEEMHRAAVAAMDLLRREERG